ncbi:hypothetical protein AX17_006504 [Amanita inopinata Kibby_2008]|nr:hypothetical protein AX17_006504 [Amanita inopinata Kibby_2008]
MYLAWVCIEGACEVMMKYFSVDRLSVKLVNGWSALFSCSPDYKFWSPFGAGMVVWKRLDVGMKLYSETSDVELNRWDSAKIFNGSDGGGPKTTGDEAKRDILTLLKYAA